MRLLHAVDSSVLVDIKTMPNVLEGLRSVSRRAVIAIPTPVLAECSHFQADLVSLHLRPLVLDVRAAQLANKIREATRPIRKQSERAARQGLNIDDLVLAVCERFDVEVLYATDGYFAAAIEAAGLRVRALPVPAPDPTNLDLFK